MHVVEDDGDRHLRPGKERAEEPARKGGDVVRILRAKRRQLARVRGIELARRVAEEMEKGRHVRVVGVDLVPQDLVAARLEIARDEAGLAGARRPRDPRDRAAGLAVQPREQALARHDRADRRPRRLGKRRLWLGLGQRAPPLRQAYRWTTYR